MSDNISSSISFSDDVSENKKQKINNLLKQLKEKKFKSMENDMLLDTVRECTESSSNLSEALRVKVNDIVLRGELIRTLRAKNEPLSSQSNSLLDLDAFNSLELSDGEQQTLKLTLEKAINEKGEFYLQEINELTDNGAKSLEELPNLVKFDVEEERQKLLDQQRQLLEQQKLFIDTLLTMGSKLEELVDLKRNVVPKAVDEKVLELVDESEKYNLRQRILDQQIRVSIFKELPISSDAYRKAWDDLMEQQKECEQEEETLQKEIEKYEDISKNEEFQELLKVYQQYKQQVENKLYIYNQLIKNKTEQK